MTTTGAPTAVLTNQLQALLNGRRVIAAVFTSFTLEPQFFEEEILTLLAGDDLIQEPKVRLVQMEELLRGEIGPVAVYYDHGGLRPEGTSKLDVRYLPVRVKTGLFHPKLALLLTAPEETSAGAGSALICGVLSANLAKRAWWETLECAHFEVVEQDSKCSFRDELLECTKAIRALGGREPDHAALDLIRRWLQKATSQTEHATENGRLRTRLIAGTRAFLDAVDDMRGAALVGCSLEVISPGKLPHQVDTRMVDSEGAVDLGK